MAVPCTGVFYPEKKQGFLLFTCQEICGKNLGFTFSGEKLTVSCPSNRSEKYRFCNDYDTQPEKGIEVKKGQKLSLNYRLFCFDCESIAEFFKEFFYKRKCLLSDRRNPLSYTDELWNLLEEHYNAHNWSGEYYAEVSKKWQCGWVGGGMSSLPLMIKGNELSKERAAKTLDFMVAYQAKSGFFHGIVENGIIRDDSFGMPGMEGIHLVRKSADALYFLFKHFEITIPKKAWVEAAKKCADAFVKLFSEYETFGQFVNVETGELLVGSTASAVFAVAALAKAWEYFGNAEYLDTARRAGEFYYKSFVAKGVTNGGPGEILGAPDSESAFAALESFVVLYQLTKEEKWLQYAENALFLCSSWVVTYSYKFPENCEFYRLGINTVGSVFANVQNKHSAPGICTMSGDCIYKLYKFTGKSEYLELIKDIAACIPQCVSTLERPVYSWDIPPKKLLDGYVCERVNMSDWEGDAFVGGVFFDSCWCETSLALGFVELMKYDEFKS